MGDLSVVQSVEDIAWNKKFLGSRYDDTSMYPANDGVTDVTSSIRGVVEDSYRFECVKPFLGGAFVGSGEALEDCGKVAWVGVCEHEAPGDVASHVRRFGYHNCESLLCPVCFKIAVNRAVGRIMDRLRFLDGVFNEAIGSGGVWSDWAVKHGLDKVRRLSVSHHVFSVPKSMFDKDFGELRSYFCKSILPRFGTAVGGVVVVHQFRLSEACKRLFAEKKKRGLVDGGIFDWVRSMGRDFEALHKRYSPHIHFVGVGRFEASKKIFKKSGWVHKKKGILRSEKDIKACLQYILGHCSVSFREGSQGYGQAYSWVGMWHNRVTKKVEEHIESEIALCVCEKKGRIESLPGRVVSEEFGSEGEFLLDWNEVCYSRDHLDLSVGVEDDRRFVHDIKVVRSYILNVALRGIYLGEDLRKDILRFRENRKKYIHVEKGVCG